MNIKILDACAIIAFLKGELGADFVEDHITDPTSKCYLHAVNAAEVYTWYLKNGSVADATDAIAVVLACGIEIREDIDIVFWKEVATHKASITSATDPITGRKRTISIADCFALALALRLIGSVITSDHREFEYVKSSGICKVGFFGAVLALRC